MAQLPEHGMSEHGADYVVVDSCDATPVAGGLVVTERGAVVCPVCGHRLRLDVVRTYNLWTLGK